MHPCLHIPELVSSIVDNFNFSDVEQRTLAGLARTCKSFHGPALDALWRHQTSLDPILACLPADAWEKDAEKSQDRITIVRPITMEEWERLSTYTHRVRVLQLTAGWTFGPATQTLKCLAALFPNGGMFPNLRELIWHEDERRNVLKYIRPVLCPKLTAMQINLSLADVKRLHDLPIPYGDLVSLVIGTNYIHGDQRCIPESLNVVSRCSRVTRLVLPSVCLGTFNLASHLPQLHTLELETQQLPTWNRVSVDEAAVAPDPFPALRVLKLTDTIFDVGIAVLQHLPSWNLQELLIETCTAPKRETIRQLYALISEHLSPSWLETLHISRDDYGEPMTDPSPEELEDHMVHGGDLVPLLAFTNLTRVCLESAGGFELDDTLIWNLAGAWPQLSSLRIGCGSEVFADWQPHYPTLDSLRAFSQHCPHLVDLHIPLNTSRGVPKFATFRHERTAQYALKRIYVDKAPLQTREEAPAIAQYLSGIFPRLVEVVTWGPERWADDRRGFRGPEFEDEDGVEYEYHWAWMEVNRFLPIFSATRWEERCCGGSPWALRDANPSE
ncbi:hypothetical protein MKEN_00184500 [Mycena kentingensis (nom. inval.)]|nr:hypothetical protein MKEN_00184500 [Mycena kentingensis (nom. inval.)]